eukprot:m.38732 g.38732  ORF g.38732 m.38732 type:complete len:310 (-) comp9467_c0_seq2:113-1042(-)
MADDGWLKDYYEEGYVILKDVIPADVVQTCRSACSQLVDKLATRLLSEGLIEETHEDKPFETRLMHLCQSCPQQLPNLFRKELHEADFYDFLCHPNLMEKVVKILKDAENVRIFPNYSARPKTPSGIHEVVWHQDAGLLASGLPNTTPIEERMNAFGLSSTVNVWSPLVQATTQNGCMKFVPRSQKLGILEHESVGAYEGVDGDGKQLASEASVGAYKTTIKASLMAPLEKDALDIELGPGDVVLFSNILVHRGGTNTSDGIRWSLDWRFQDAAKSTMRSEQGHVVWSRQRTHPEIVRDGSHWAQLELY